MQRWTRAEMLYEIQRIHAEGEPLNYQEAERNHLGLVRAATAQWGSWGNAVRAAGIDYDAVRKYREWNKERVRERIRWWHKQGADLSWSHVSRSLDPALGAAAVRPKHFGSWAAAITAAGLDYGKVSRYHRWTKERVMRRIAHRDAEGLSLKAGDVLREDSALVSAARRWFRDWNEAVSTALTRDQDTGEFLWQQSPQAAPSAR